MYDRFLVKTVSGSVYYTTSFKELLEDNIVEVIKHERTFDDGATWITL